MKLLTDELVNFFRHQGFLKLPEGLSEDRVAALKKAMWQDIRDEVGPLRHDGEGRVWRLSNMWERDAIFRDILTCDEIITPLTSLLGPNIVFVRNRANHATPRYPNSTTPADRPHRDLIQWSRTGISVLIYLEAATVESGCTCVLPGSHQVYLEGHSVFETDNGKEVRDVAGRFERVGLLEQMVPVPMPPGGILFVDIGLQVLNLKK